MADDLQEKLDEQLRYYRARAPEYDAWALREGGFDRGPRERAKWFADIAKLERALTGSIPPATSWNWRAGRVNGRSD